MTDTLKFKHEWILGDRIGGGGFGQVYAAKSAEQETAVVKLVPKAPGAARELLFVNLDGARNVVPIMNSGETRDSWAIAMLRAEKSLREHLDQIGTPLETADAIAILKHIGTALVDLDGKVVHRDLKPENILLLNGLGALPTSGSRATPRQRRHRTPRSMPYRRHMRRPSVGEESGRRPEPTSIHSAL
jgi:serine/threonine protein kinase